MACGRERAEQVEELQKAVEQESAEKLATQEHPCFATEPASLKIEKVSLF